MSSVASSLSLITHLDFPDQRTILDMLKADPLIQRIPERTLDLLTRDCANTLVDPDYWRGTCLTISLALGSDQQLIDAFKAALKACAVIRQIVQQR